MKFTLDHLTKLQAESDNAIVDIKSKMDELNEQLQNHSIRSQELGRAIQAVKMVR